MTPIYFQRYVLALVAVTMIPAVAAFIVSSVHMGISGSLRLDVSHVQDTVHKFRGRERVIYCLSEELLLNALYAASNW